MSRAAIHFRTRRWGYYAVLILTAVCFFWLTGYDALAELTDSWREEREMEQAIQQLEEKNQRLEAVIQELAPGGKAVERIARQELGMAKGDEIVVKIPEKK